MSVDPDFDDSFGEAVASEGDLIAVSAPLASPQSAFVFDIGADGVVEADSLEWSTPAGTRSGSSAIAIDGDRVYVSAARAGDPTVRLIGMFEPDGAGGWEQLDHEFASTSEYFGNSIAADAGRLVVAAPDETRFGPGTGAVHVFEPDGAGGWTETILTASDGFDRDGFGNSVAVDGDRIVVGATQFGGATYVYEADGVGGWSETKLVASTTSPGDGWGSAVAIEGDVIVASGPGEDPGGALNRGAVARFELEDDRWTESVITVETGRLGRIDTASIAISDGRIFVPTLQDSNSIEGVYVFEPDGADGGWNRTLVVASDGERGDLFGSSIAASGDRLVVGARRYDEFGRNSGTAYVFERVAGPAPTCLGQPATLFAAGDITGTPGNDVIVGSPGPDRIFALDGDDIICGADGDDILVGGNHDDIVVGGPGADSLRGGPGTDTANYSESLSGVIVRLNNAADDGGPGEGDQVDLSIENITGSDFGDLIVGSVEANRLDGGAGADVIRGRAGDDTLIGGPGNDILQGNSGIDLIDAGTGNDRLIGGPDNDTLQAGDGNDYCRGSAGFDTYFNCETADP